MEPLYAAAVGWRNARFDRRGPEARLPVPVISVGNLTVGGTGKTPFVIDLVHRLDRMGLSPAVVSRGYGAAAGEPNDEERLIRRRCPGVPCVSHPDRAEAGSIACRQFGADIIVLDDGFQHRRLHRTLDIVLLDATCPFGFGHLLPRGLLREPVASLGRAGVVVLTRCDQVSQAALSETEARVRRVAGEAVRLRCSHRVTSIETVDGKPSGASFDGQRAVVFAGIGNPDAFLTTVRSLGVDVVGTHWWPDHHRYRRRDVDRLASVGRFPAHDLLITTEKDAVKLLALGGLPPVNLSVVKVSIDFAGQDGTMLQTALDRSLARA
jgi:tetraacyldisaccharide 4'-kinase